jgi:hypothetical protein
MQMASRWIVAIFCLSGCSTQISSKEVFTASSADALVIFGVDSRVGGYEIGFSRYNDTSERNSFTGGKRYDRTLSSPKSMDFIVDTWKPGIYTFTSYCYVGYPQTCVNFSLGTAAFEIKPGKINYLGNVILGERSASQEGFTDDMVKEYLKGFPYVNADLFHVEFRTVQPKGLWDK